MPSGSPHAQRFGPALALYPPAVLLTRAARELLPGYGFIVSEADRDRFAREVPTAHVAEIDANHYGIVTAETTATAISAFFEASF